MKNIKNIFLILFLVLPVVGFFVGGFQGLIVTVMVLFFAVGSYLAFLMSSKMSGSEDDYFSFDRMRSFLEHSWEGHQRAELSEAMPAVLINDFIRVDYSLFAAFRKYFDPGSNAVQKEDRLLTNYGTSIVYVDGAIRGFSFKFEHEENEGEKSEIERCYAVHKDYIQETLLRYYLEKYRNAFFLLQKNALGSRYLQPNMLAWKKVSKENREIAVGLDARAESWAKEQYQNYLTTGDRTQLPLDFESLDAAFRKELYAFVKRYRLMIDKDEVEKKLAKEISQSREDLKKCLRYLA
ncbi:hypothetical protein [Trichococcus alkaliphilus]|uniref:hypothetical protein n=1 Tax=Trichococcus alkaliphilus TaxID=2052943 RepID=UPI000D0B2C04|nr:hypothetical protein [Trichococcus alkaliphilus]